jgi:DNA-binding CsgD family transcriptional regulator
MEDLTEREEEVLELVAAGYGTRTIAERLWIAVATVRNHIRNIIVKLEVHNRIQAVNRWRELQAQPVERVLSYCRRSGIRLTDLQAGLVRAAFSASEVSCQGNQHVFPDGAERCLCRRLRVS